MLEMKSIVTEMKNNIICLIRRLETAEEIISQQANQHQVDRYYPN